MKTLNQKTIITFGTFDVFHVGHLRILERAKSMGNRLIVGISTDALNFSKKSRYPVYCEAERMEIVAALKCVDDVFKEVSLQLKADYIQRYQSDIFVMGNDWAGKFDEFKTLCEVIYLERTPAISTTALIEKIRT